MSRAVLLAGFLLLYAAVLPAFSAETGPRGDVDAQGSTPAQGAAPRVPTGVRAPLDLDSLLRPRIGIPAAAPPSKASELPGGRGLVEWRETFALARNDVVELEGRLRTLQEKIRAASSGEWGYSPVGAGAPSDPEVLKLRAAVRRDRKSLEVAQARLRELEVEASLSGVPDSWRGPAQSN